MEINAKNQNKYEQENKTKRVLFCKGTKCYQITKQYQSLIQNEEDPQHIKEAMQDIPQEHVVYIDKGKEECINAELNKQTKSQRIKMDEKMKTTEKI